MVNKPGSERDYTTKRRLSRKAKKALIKRYNELLEAIEKGHLPTEREILFIKEFWSLLMAIDIARLIYRK